jgi:hypothetical protein
MARTMAPRLGKDTRQLLNAAVVVKKLNAKNGMILAEPLAVRNSDKTRSEAVAVTSFTDSWVTEPGIASVPYSPDL